MIDGGRLALSRRVGAHFAKLGDPRAAHANLQAMKAASAASHACLANGEGAGAAGVAAIAAARASLFGDAAPPSADAA